MIYYIHETNKILGGNIMKRYYSYNVTQEQKNELAKLRKEYKNIPYCSSYIEAEAVINKYKYTLKGLDAPVTRSQKKILAILRNEFHVKLPFCNTQKMAAGIINRYDKKYHVLHNKRLEGYHCVFEGKANQPMTAKQLIIIDSLAIRYGDKIIPEIKTRKEAWDFINKYQEVIYSNENGFFIDKENINLLKKEVDPMEVFTIEDLF
jgi:hypothetical protein